MWTFTGGVAKYIELLIDAKSWTLESMIRTIVRDNSLFLDEGRAVLVEEFDKEYGVYFSILCAIARGRTSRNENELTGKYAVCEVKRQGGKIDLAAVRKKCEAFRCATGEWRKVVPTYKALSLKDM